MSAASHLLQMRGLKQQLYRLYPMDRLSHLLQMRGLKLLIILKSINLLLSHLLQMRGLKQNKLAKEKAHEGRIFYRCVD